MCDRFFLFGNLQRLNRQADTAVALIEIGHHRVQLIADMETLRALVLTVARQIGTTDKGRDIALGNRHFQTAIGNRRHLASHRVATAQIGNALKRVAVQLLDAKADAFFFLVNIQHHGFHRVAFIILRQRFIARCVPIEVGNMHHAVNIIIETDKQTELGNVFNLARQLGADREFR